MSSRTRPASSNHSRRPKPTTIPSLSAIPAMSTQTLRLLLDRYHLTSTGRRDLLIKRLGEHLRADPHAEDDRSGSGSSSNSDPGSGKKQDHADDDRAHSSAERDDPDQLLEYHADDSDFSDAERGQHSSPSRGRRADHASRQERHSSRRSRHRRQRPRHHHHRHTEPLRRTGKGSHSQRAHSREPGYRSRSDREDHHSRRHRHCFELSPTDTSSSEEYRPRYRRRSSSSSSSSSSSMSSSGTSTSSDSSRDRHHRRRRQHSSRHRRRSSHHHSHTSAAAVVSCSPPLPHHVQRKIKKGEYVNFDRLLSSADSPPFAHPRRHHHHKATSCRSVTDLASWLEAWNRYLCVAIAYEPSRSLELAKYQTIVCMLFTHYPPQAGVAYDQHFRQQAAIRPATGWDRLKEDIFMWALHPSRTATHPTSPPLRENPQPFRDGRPPAVRPGPPRPFNEPHVSHDATGAKICRRYNAGKCPRDDLCKFSHRCWVPGCNGAHPAKGCPKRTW